MSRLKRDLQLPQTEAIEQHQKRPNGGLQRTKLLSQIIVMQYKLASSHCIYLACLLYGTGMQSRLLKFSIIFQLQIYYIIAIFMD